jgi:hypothetical protein
MKTIVRCLVTAVAVFAAVGRIEAADPLPSWNDTAPKKAVVGRQNGRILLLDRTRLEELAQM